MRGELRATLALAWPVILAEIGWVLMGVVDTVVVGPLGPAAIGAVGTGSTIFFAVAVLGMGTLYALDTFVSQSYGARQIDDCHRWLVAGMWLALAMAVVLILILLGVVELLPAVGVRPEILAILQPYLRALSWSVPPLLVYTVLRRYVQAMGWVRPVMISIVAANLVNVVANYVLVFGWLGGPVLGPVGAAYATLASRVVMAGVLAAFIVHRERRESTGLAHIQLDFDAARVRRLVTLGVPAALQMVLEVGVFAAASALAGRISPTALAANQIVLNIAGLFFMVPLGLSAAAAVRVGQAVGRGQPADARRAGWAALIVASAASIATIALYLGMPRQLIGVFTDDPTALTVGTTLLAVCSVFLLFDGFQVVATGALRGIGDTRTPMLCNLAGHWCVGLPVGYWLCFARDWSVVGLWTGLSVGLVLVGGTLVVTWAWRMRTAAATPLEMG